jgi:hypothetical protein
MLCSCNDNKCKCNEPAYPSAFPVPPLSVYADSRSRSYFPPNSEFARHTHESSIYVLDIKLQRNTEANQPVLQGALYRLYLELNPVELNGQDSSKDLKGLLWKDGRVTCNTRQQSHGRTRDMAYTLYETHFLTGFQSMQDLQHLT